jgi:hypothetical protein
MAEEKKEKKKGNLFDEILEELEEYEEGCAPRNLLDSGE